jgi:hypothetical protein
MTDDIEGLLPWYAVEALDRRDAKRIEEALAKDPELARRYAMVRDELDEAVSFNEALGGPSSYATERLFTKIDDEPARRPAVTVNLGARVTQFFAGFSPRALAWSASAAAVAIVLQAGIIAAVAIHVNNGAGFQIASAPATEAHSGTFALIRFAPQADSDAITRFLEANQMQIAAGPMSGGFYKVRVAAAGTPRDEVAGIIKRLSEDKVVNLIATAE